LDRVFL